MSNTPSRFRRKAKTATITLAVDPDDAEVIKDAQDALAGAEAELKAPPTGGKSAGTLRRRVETAKAHLADVIATHPVVTLTVERLPDKDRERILSDHPATAEEQAEYERTRPDDAPETMGFSPDGYFPALLAASCIDVRFSDEDDSRDGLSPEEAKDLWESAGQGDKFTIQVTCQALVMAGSSVEALGKG